MPAFGPGWAAIFALAVAFSLPIGPVQIEVWREALAGRRGRALRIAAGASLVDSLWALAAYQSLFSRSLPRPVQGAFFLASAGLTVFLGFRALRPASPQKIRLAGRNWCFLQGTACVLLNPTGIVSWTIGLGLLKKLGLTLPAGMPFPAFFFAVVFLGAISYPILVIALAGKMRGRLRPEHVDRVSRGLAYLLFGLGTALLFQAARAFL